MIEALERIVDLRVVIDEPAQESGQLRRGRFGPRGQATIRPPQGSELGLQIRADPQPHTVAADAFDPAVVANGVEGRPAGGSQDLVVQVTIEQSWDGHALEVCRIGRDDGGPGDLLERLARLDPSDQGGDRRVGDRSIAHLDFAPAKRGPRRSGNHGLSCRKNFLYTLKYSARSRRSSPR